MIPLLLIFAGFAFLIMCIVLLLFKNFLLQEEKNDLEQENKEWRDLLKKYIDELCKSLDNATGCQK